MYLLKFSNYVNIHTSIDSYLLLNDYLIYKDDTSEYHLKIVYLFTTSIFVVLCCINDNIFP